MNFFDIFQRQRIFQQNVGLLLLIIFLLFLSSGYTYDDPPVVQNAKPAVDADTATSLPVLPEVKPLHFATDWFDISGKNKKDQKKIIIKKVKEYFKTLMIRNSWNRERLLDVKKITKLNNQWMNEKRKQNEQWLNEFLEREARLNHSYQQLVEAIQDTERITLDIKGRRSEIRKSEFMREAQKKLIEQIKTWIEKNNQNLESRLAFLSLGTIVVSKIQKEPFMIKGDAELKKHIQRRMIEEAIRKIKGEKIQTLTQIRDTSITRYISKENEGKAQVSDMYFNTLKVSEIKDTIEVPYTYSIQYIEVFPFSREKIKRSTLREIKTETKSEDEDEVKVYFLEGNLLIPSDNIGKRVSIDSIQFNDKGVFEYLKNLRAIAQKSESRIRKEIEKYKNEYTMKDSAYRNRLSDAVKLLDEYKKKVENYRKENGEDTQRLEEYRSKIAHLERQYKQHKKSYEKFYKNKFRLVNNVQLGLLDNLPLDKMAQASYQAIKDEIKATQISNHVMIEYSGGGTNLISLKAKPINYNAQIDSFKILYLTKIDPLLILNLAFRVKYSSEKYIKIDSVKGIITDVGAEKEWAVLDTNIMSIVYYTKPPADEGWKVPTFSEILDFQNTLKRYNEDKDVHPFKIVNWPMDYPYMSDPMDKEDKYTNEDNEVLYKCFDFSNFSRVDKYAEEIIHVIFNRDIPKKTK